MVFENSERQIIVTGREYQEVVGDLFLPIKKNDEQELVLTVGEGLSNFGSEYHLQTGSNVIAADPLYAVTYPKRGMRRIKQDLAPYPIWINETYVRKNVGMEEEGRGFFRIAATIDQLPFPDAVFDAVFGHRVIEYVHMGRAIKELLRVLKSKGEMRLGMPLAFEKTNNGTSLCHFGAHERDMNGDQWAIQHFQGTEEFIEHWRERPEIQCYAIVGDLGWKLCGGMIIIRRDREIPRVDFHKNKSKHLMFSLHPLEEDRADAGWAVRALEVKKT